MGLFDTLKGMGDKAQMLGQAQAIQRQLAAERIETTAQTAKGLLKIVLSGDQKVMEISYDGVRDYELERAVGDAIYKSQMTAAGKMKDLLPGMG